MKGLPSLRQYTMVEGDEQDIHRHTTTAAMQCSRNESHSIAGTGVGRNQPKRRQVKIIQGGCYNAGTE